MGESPGLVVIDRDSCSEGRGFNPSTMYKMDIFKWICCKNYNVYWQERLK